MQAFSAMNKLLSDAEGKDAERTMWFAGEMCPQAQIRSLECVVNGRVRVFLMSKPVFQSFQTHSSAVFLIYLYRDPLFGPFVQPNKVPNVVPAGRNLPTSSPVVASHPFVGVPTQRQSPATVLFSERGPVRFTRFVEMSLDSHCAHLNEMISQGRIEHIGRASIHLEKATAWGVWLRIDQWSSALGNKQRLTCGALHQAANGTVTFHGVAGDGARLD